MAQLDILIKDKAQQFHSMHFDITDHCKERLAQRGINHRLLSLALLYGTEVTRQGLNFYYVLDKNVPSSLPTHMKHKLAQLVVVCDDTIGSVITIYHGYKGLIHIKKKRKNLNKWAA